MSGKKPKLGEAAQVLFGFRVQELRFLVRLIEAKPGDVAWIEYFDDVGVTKSDGTMIVEQDTTSQTGNPLQDRAEKIWKTIANWVRGANAGWYNPSQCEFALFIPQSISPGSLVQQVIDANDEIKATAALQAVRESFWGAAPAFLKKSSVSKTLVDHIETILANESLASKIVARFTIQSGDHAGLVKNLYAALDGLLGFPKGERRREHFIKQAIGHLMMETTPLLEGGQLVKVSRESFNEFAQNYIYEYMRSDYLSSLSSDPTAEEVGNVLSSSPVFVRQLLAIKWESNDIIQQINNYIRTQEDVVAWSEDSEVTIGQIKKFEARLIGYWAGQRSYFLHDGLTPEQFGCKIAGCCLSQNFELLGRKVDYHITSGTYHHLADGDGKTVSIGWHPSFKDMFEKGGGV